MSQNKDNMKQEEEYKKAVSILNELENLCLEDSKIEKVKLVFSPFNFLVCGIYHINLFKGTIRSDQID
jgi:hypothetical protein